MACTHCGHPGQPLHVWGAFIYLHSYYQWLIHIVAIQDGHCTSRVHVYIYIHIIDGSHTLWLSWTATAHLECMYIFTFILLMAYTHCGCPGQPLHVWSACIYL